MVFVLCLGFKVQAQSLAITEYNAKLNSLTDMEEEILDDLVNGAPSMIFINTDSNQPEAYQPSGEQIKMIMLNKPSDVTPLLNAYKGQLNGVRVINIEWNGTDSFTFPTNFLAELPSVQYVYIRSYQDLSKAKIESAFQRLIQQLSEEMEVEILYSTMEQPQ
jgi:hypothetical protein